MNTKESNITLNERFQNLTQVTQRKLEELSELAKWYLAIKDHQRLLLANDPGLTKEKLRKMKKIIAIKMEDINSELTLSQWYL